MTRTSVSVFALLAFTLSAPSALAETAGTQAAMSVNPAAANTNQDWWPERLDLTPLRQAG